MPRYHHLHYIWLQVLALATGNASARSNYTTSSRNSTTGVIASIPSSWTYLLPDGFYGNVNGSFINDTTTSDSRIDSTLHAATQAPFIAYDEEFYDIFGNSQITLIQDRTAENEIFPFEAGVWVPERDEVWFASDTSQGAEGSEVFVLNLNTSVVSTLETSGTERLRYSNGGYYFQGKVYFATYPSNTTYRGGIYSVDVQTLRVEPVVNSYFGLPFVGCDDVVWATKGNDTYLYFTDFPYSSSAWGDTAPVAQLPSGVWRWDPQNDVVQQVIPRNDINPNGIRVSPDQRTLYVTDSSPTYYAAEPNENTLGGASSWLGPYIYQYDLDEDMYPSRRRVFGLVRKGIADGIHVDDAGRVWTAEGEGIVIRSPKSGKVLGLVNGQYFLANNTMAAAPIANFALAGDQLIIAAQARLYAVRLAKELVSRDSIIVN